MNAACLACGVWMRGRLCPGCRATLAPAADRRLATGLLVRAAFRHDGAARRLVHRLKYQGHGGAATVLAVAMADRLPATASSLVPVPRAQLRRWRHGVDPARDLAAALGRITGLPVVTALRAGWWWPAHAGRGRDGRELPGFRGRVGGSDMVLVDDVVTTGATLASAAAALSRGVIAAATATSAPR